MDTRIVKIDAGMRREGADAARDGAGLRREDADIINEAAALLRAGRLVAFPTETVYGLGGDALNENAVQEIYKVKGRPPDNPLILHIYDMAQLGALAGDIGEAAAALAGRFWPGPLTLIIKKRAELPMFTSAGLDTVAVRMPSHPVARALLKAAGTPISAPSANLSGKPSTTKGGHVIDDLNGKIDMIIDSGPAKIGLESTVLDVSRVPAVILRPGAVTFEEIASVIGRENICGGRMGPPGPAAARCAAVDQEAGPTANRSPGTKYKHYSPDAPMLLFSGDRRRAAFWMARFLRAHSRRRAKVAVLASEEFLGEPYISDELSDRPLKTSAPETPIPAPKAAVYTLGSDKAPESAAADFFDALRACDKNGSEIIFCELYTNEGIGAALADRMKRAAGGNIFDADAPSVLFVCSGNTCRSAMAEAIFNLLAQGGGLRAPAESAGLWASRGAPAARDAACVMKEYGADLTRHSSRQLTDVEIAKASLALAMTRPHRSEIAERHPLSAPRLFTFTEFIGGFDYDIDDPYGLGVDEYRACAAQLYGLTAAFIREMLNAYGPSPRVTV